jgi:flavodoxin
MMKILIVYYSLTGNTKLIADAIKEELNADILALKPTKELKPESGMKYMWGGAQAIMKRKPQLEEITVDPLSYDLIFLGSPIWAWTYSPPMRSFLTTHNLSGKKVALWTCHAGEGIKSMIKFQKAMKNTIIVGHISFQDPLTNRPEQMKKNAQTWAQEIVQKME